MSLLVDYFRKKIAKPFNWELGRREYGIEILTVDELASEITAAVTMKVERLGVRAEKAYVGETSLVVRRGETREEVLDQIVVAVDGHFEKGHLDPRVKRALAAFDDDEEKEIVEEPELPRISRELPFERPWDEREKVLDYLETGFRGAGGKDLLAKALEFSPSDADLWQVKAERSTDPDVRIKYSDVALRLAWAGVKDWQLEAPVNLSAQTGDAGCVLRALAIRSAALFGKGDVEGAYDVARFHVSLDDRDGFGMRFWHAALAVLNDDREEGEKALATFRNPEWTRHAPSVWTHALLETAFGEDGESVVMEAIALNDHAVQAILEQPSSWLEMWDIGYSSGSPEEARWISILQAAAWRHLGDPEVLLKASGGPSPR